MTERRPRAPAGAPFAVDGLPEVMERAFPAFFIGLGVLATVGLVVEGGGENPWLAVVLVGISVSPWVLALAGAPPRDTLFVTLVVAPIAVLVLFGEPLGVVDLDEGWPQLVMMLLVGISGQVGHMGSHRLVVGTTTAVVGTVVVGALVRGQPLDYTPWLVGVVLGVLGGRAFRANAIHLAALRATQEAMAQQRLADERRRLARDVHDIVAHTMSVTMLHLTAARLALRTDPDAAETALVEAERHGRASMDEVRGIVRLLRTDEDAVAPALPDASEVATLVDRYVSAGSDVRLCVDGSLAELPGAQRLAVFRVVQESLTNAVRHGCDPVEVRVASSGGGVEVEVRNGRRADAADAPPPGAGIVGMRERIEALDGSFAAGPEGSGWRVRARIPA